MTAVKNHIITAANSKFYKSFCLLMYSYRQAKEYENSEVIFYDLGLSEDQARTIKTKSNQIFEHVDYRTFNYENYPDFVKPSFNTYSWKPIIIHLCSQETKGNFLWMDSANCILKNLNPIWREIETQLTYAPISGSGRLEEWTMQQTLDYLNVPKEFYSKRNRAGNTFGFSNKSEVVRELITKWKDLALVKECIRPEGANRTNHRDDQSLLTILLLDYANKGHLKLTTDEVDISSGHPTKFLSVRNKFPERIPLSPGGLAFQYFSLLRFLDVMVNRIKGN
ncbi:DUF1647 domain-containing protein [Ekhidna sp.]|uniref:DUF1647 domain-containing protein n=1 Tax=Ekhidna sp. TaxID=2608089 RepID=UPI003296CD00